MLYRVVSLAVVLEDAPQPSLSVVYMPLLLYSVYIIHQDLALYALPEPPVASPPIAQTDGCRPYVISF